MVGCSGGGDDDGRDAGDGPAATERVAPGEGGGTVTIRDVRIFDGETVLDADTVVVEGGLITAVGRGLTASPASEVVAGDGGFLLPGLIDAHGHTNDVGMLADSLRFGVTTVLDMFSQIGANDVGESLRAQRAVLTSTHRADFWSAGILVTAPGGHGTQFGISIPVLAAGDDADEFVAARVAEGSDYVKLVIEDGSQLGRVEHYGALVGEELGRDESVPDRIRHMMQVMAQAIAADRQLQTVIFTRSRLFRASGYLKDKELATYAQLADLLATGQGRGEIRTDVEPVQLAEVLTGVFQLTITNWLTGWWDNEDADLDVRLLRAVDVFLAGCETQSR